MPKQRESLVVDTLIKREQAILAAIDERETLGFLSQLVAFNTENPPGSEAGIAEFLATEFRIRGIDIELDQVIPGRSNLTARIGPRNGPCLLLNAHTDTMPAGVGWSNPPQDAQIRDGR